MNNRRQCEMIDYVSFPSVCWDINNGLESSGFMWNYQIIFLSFNYLGGLGPRGKLNYFMSLLGS